MIIEKINLKSLLPIIGIITGFELLSFLSYRTPWLNSVFFILICLLAAILTYKKLEWGVWMILTELMIGSQGYLFYAKFHESKLSIRIGLFTTFLAVWLFRHSSWSKIKEYSRERTVQLFYLFLGVMAVGGILGLLYHNELGNIIADGKRYLYFGLFFVFFDVFTNRQTVYNLLKILFATVITLSVKSGALLLIFIHNIGNEWTTKLVYTWVRTSSRVGEITDMKNGFYRIFIQSQIFELITIFIAMLFIGWILYQRQNLKKEADQAPIKGSRDKTIFYFSLLTLSSFTVIMGLSRSFWAGAAGSVLIALPLLIFRLKLSWKPFLETIGLSILALVSSIVLVGVVFGGSLGSRFKGGEPAAASRWNLLPPLMTQARLHPIIGSGFGTTVNYKTEDPRIKNESNPEGWNTTYAFEWGYIDFIVKFGVIGTLIYFWFLGYVMCYGWKLTKERSEDSFIIIGFLLGYIAVLGTHMFSPYLNHPLGIGYILMSIGVFRALKLAR